MSDDQELSLRLVAKANRERLADAHREVVMRDEAKKAVDIRKNMARLKELRLAKEAQEVRTEISTGNNSAKAKPKKRFR